MPDTSPPNPEASTTADEQQLAASIDALLAAGSETGVAAPETPGANHHPITAPASGPEQAVQSVEDLLADVAAELTATEPAVAPQPAAEPTAPEQPLDSVLEQVAADLAAESNHTEPTNKPGPTATLDTKPSAPATPPAVDKVEEQLAAIASELSEQIQTAAEAAADKSDPGSVKYHLATSPSSASVTGPAPTEVHAPPAAPTSRVPLPAGSIEELDQTLADVAEQVLADDQSTSAAARIDAAQNAAPAPAPAEPPPATAAPAPTAAAPSTSLAAHAPVAEKPVQAPAPAPEVRQPSRLAPLGQRVLLAISNAASRLSPTVRQTMGWLAVYTALLAVGVWGYLLLRGEAKPMDPTSEPVPFLQPGEHAPEPKPKSAGHAEPADTHGKSGEKPPAKDAHGAAKKPDSKTSDSHGEKSAKASAKKPPEKKKADKKPAEHH